ncbi:MAG: FkbM family methyltransferase [Bacteroidales bacterium]|nr:FkbM family methyltransferase [Bacteroidales bacterium]
MKIIEKVLNSKFVERTKRKISLATGFHLKLKRLSSSSSEDFRTVKILNTYNFTCVLDIGANTGQFAESLIDFGYKNKIISFEPTQSAYNTLTKRSAKYPKWEVAERCAIGNISGEVDINVSDNSVFSSIKEIKDNYVEYNQSSRSSHTEKVKLYPLDYFAGKYINPNEKTFLKIDTQGFEKEVLEGAKKILPGIDGVKIEIPLESIYQSVDWKLPDIITYFYEKGFTCQSLQPVAVNNKTGAVLEVDGIFIRTS